MTRRLAFSNRLVMLMLLTIFVVLMTGAGDNSAAHPSLGNHRLSAQGRGAQADALSSSLHQPLSASVPHLQTISPLSETVAISIPLGTTYSITLTFVNTSSQTLQPKLYEAWPLPSSSVVPFSITKPLGQMALPQQEKRVDTQIYRDMAASTDGSASFLVFFRSQPDLSAAYAMEDWVERGRYVYETLYTNAEQSQQTTRAWLEEQGIDYQPLWIVNAIAVQGDEPLLQELAGRAEVALIRADYTITLDDEPVTEPDSPDPSLSAVMYCRPDERNVCWNISKIGADAVWEKLGVTGEGIVIANIDTGVDYDHPALLPHYRGYQSDGQVSHEYNWYDPASQQDVPYDNNDHGTHTMGTMVARSDGTADQPALGVAPGAKWIAAKGCASSSCSDSHLIASAQWFLAPRDANGENPRPDLRPHIVNNSWASEGAGSAKEEEMYEVFTTAWRASGILPVFANGNDGSPECGSVGSPASNSNVLGIGATDYVDNIASFSRFGPSYNGTLKPDVVAPGVGVASTEPGNGLQYRSMSGTSMAAPHVAGVAALLWSTDPSLIGDFDETYDLLTQYAVPRTDDAFDDPKYEACSADEVPNNVYGYGRVDAFAAAMQARVDVPWLVIPQDIPEIAPQSSQVVTLTLESRRIGELGEHHARVLVSDGSGDNLATSLRDIDLTMTTVITDALGTVRGTVVDDETGEPLNAMVFIRNGPQATVDEQGAFDLLLPAGTTPSTYTLQFNAFDYIPKSTTITLTNGLEHDLNITLLADRPRISVDTTPINVTHGYLENDFHTVTISNAGVSLLEYKISVPEEAFTVWRSDERYEKDNVSYEWITPEESTTVPLGDDAHTGPIPIGFLYPIADSFYTTVHVISNGVLAFDTPKQFSAFDPIIPPLDETDGKALFPLRLDLNPSDGGRISYASVPEGFLVTFEDVPLFGENQRTYSFQVLLTPRGVTRFTYKDLSMLPVNGSVGVQIDSKNVQFIGKGESMPIEEGLTLELRPQTRTSEWLRITSSSALCSGSRGPGEVVSIMVETNWEWHNAPQPYRGSVLIESNDLAHPQVRVPVEVWTQKPPYEIMLSPVTIGAP